MGLWKPDTTKTANHIVKLSSPTLLFSLHSPSSLCLFCFSYAYSLLSLCFSCSYFSFPVSRAHASFFISPFESKKGHLERPIINRKMIFALTKNWRQFITRFANTDVLTSSVYTVGFLTSFLDYCELVTNWPVKVTLVQRNVKDTEKQKVSEAVIAK